MPSKKSESKRPVVRRTSPPSYSAVQLKPNGQPFGTFLITVDDGYVAYTYPLRPRSKSWSIDAMYQTIRKAFRVREESGYISKPNPESTGREA